MSNKKSAAKIEAAKTQKKPIVGKTATGENKKTGKGSASSGRAAKPVKRTSPAKKAPKATKISPKKTAKVEKKDSNVGKVYRGKTKYIDKETKPERNYVVVIDDGKRVSVSKLKSIKIFDENGKNADKALVEINATRYGLEKRTGVDFQRFNKNRMSGKPLDLSDKDVFPEGKERFKLGSHDLARSLRHTKAKK